MVRLKLADSLWVDQPKVLPYLLSCAHMGCFKSSSMSHILSLHCECSFPLFWRGVEGLQDVEYTGSWFVGKYSPNEGIVMNTIQ